MTRIDIQNDLLRAYDQLASISLNDSIAATMAKKVIVSMIERIAREGITNE